MRKDFFGHAVRPEDDDRSEYVIHTKPFARPVRVISSGPRCNYQGNRCANHCEWDSLFCRYHQDTPKWAEGGKR